MVVRFKFKLVRKKLKNIAKLSWMALIIGFSLSIIIITFSLFIIRFHDFPLSNNPSDWYDFIPIIVGVVNLVITGVIAWQVQTINKKNSRRNSVLQFLGEIYIDLDKCVNKYLGKIQMALADYNFKDVDVENLMDKFENELIKLKPKCYAFYNSDTCDNFSTLYNSVRNFNSYIREIKDQDKPFEYIDLFRDQKILDTYIIIDQNYKRTKQLMRKYMNE